MYHTIDATKVDEGPRRDNQLHMSIYYVCFVVVFSFFFLNIFVALIIVTFQEQGEKEMIGCELDRNQVLESIPLLGYIHHIDPSPLVSLQVDYKYIYIFK